MGKVKRKTVKSSAQEPKKKSASSSGKGVPWPTAVEYINLFNTCVIAKEHIVEVDNLIDKIIVPNRGRYELVANQASSISNIFENRANSGLFNLGGSAWPSQHGGGSLLPSLNSPYYVPPLMRDLPSTTPLSLSGQSIGAAINGFADPLGMQPLASSTTVNDLFGLFRFNLATGNKIPWYVVAVIHHMESSSDFKTHLHNGDPLTGYTVHVPAGRPQVGHPPPFTWEESAVDSLKTKEHFDQEKHWNLPAMLYRMERYNGAGYKNRRMPTPYLWAYSNHYTKGKFVKDRKFDSNAVSKQSGAGVVLKRMEERSIIYIPRW